MKLDATTYGHPLRDVPSVVHAAEARGFDAWLTSEVTHDPFLSLAVAAGSTERLQLGTAIAVAFARNPMTVAYATHNIQQALGGERQMILGLGSQIKPHITRRFAQPWPDRPAAAMRDFVLAVRGILAAWQGGQRLDVRTEHYTHTLMSPMFAPRSLAASPAIWIAAVGPGMTRVTGQVADGLLCHGFTTARYLAETTLPALEEGIARTEGKTRDDVEVALPLFVVTGYEEEQIAAMRATVLQQIGFYGSTPAYHGVLAAHGWTDLGAQLHHLSTTDGWADMPAAIPEEVLHAFAVVADPDELGDAIVDRVAGLADRISVPGDIALSDAHLTRLRETVADA